MESRPNGASTIVDFATMRSPHRSWNDHRIWDWCGVQMELCVVRYFSVIGIWVVFLSASGLDYIPYLDTTEHHFFGEKKGFNSVLCQIMIASGRTMGIRF